MASWKWVQFVNIGGERTEFLLPEPSVWDRDNPAPLCMYVHGYGEDERACRADSLKASVIAALLGGGYIVGNAYAGGDNFGKQAALDVYADIHAWALAHLNVSRTVILGQSMGGLPSLLLLAGGMSTAKGWAGIYPMCSLSASFNGNSGTFAAPIRTAYGIAADGSDYSTKTSGHDPALLAASAFSGKRMRFYASPDDTTVPKSSHTDAMRTLVASTATEYALQTCSGEHGDPSHFQPSDLVTFFDRCV